MNILPGRESFFHVSCLGSYRASLGGPDEGDCEPTFPTPSSGNSKNFSHKHFTHTLSNASIYNKLKDEFKEMTLMNYEQYFVGWGTLSLINAGLAQGKNRSGLKWFLISLLLGPIATFLIVVLDKK